MNAPASPPPAGAPAPSPGPSLAELIYVELLGRAFLRVNDVATIKPDPASLAKLSMELADAFTNEKKAQLAALGPKNQGYDIKIDDLVSWDNKPEEPKAAAKPADAKPAAAKT